jgi:hypothetical protein
MTGVISAVFRAVVVAAMMVGLAVAGAAGGQTPWVAPASEKAKKSPVAPGPKAVEQGCSGASAPEK